MSTLVVLRNQPSGQNLVYSTKLERIVTDSKSTRHKEKKERKKEKCDDKKKSRKHSSSKAHDDKHLKKVSDDEKSGLTEELEGPQNQLGYLSDGSQNSKKRRRVDSPLAVQSPVKVVATHVAGNPLRIRLVFKKPKEVVTQEDLVCSTSVAKPLDNSVPCLEKPVVVAQSASCLKVSEVEEDLPSTSAVALVESKKRKKHKPSKEDRYNALFDDWTLPSSICFLGNASSLKDNDEDWLFGNKSKEKLITPKAPTKIDQDTSMNSCWPKAQFLPQVGIHSLPYTVPF